MRRRGALLLAGLLATSAAAQTAGPPELLVPWLGPGAAAPPESIAFYGTDLGWTFEHAGALQMLFGDTWFDARTLCEGAPSNDDVQITLPLEPSSWPPPPHFVRADGRAQPDRIFVYRDGESLPMGFGQVPIAAFSDGARAVGIFGRWDPARCAAAAGGAPPSCGSDGGLVCSPHLGQCTPSLLGITAVCELAPGRAASGRSAASLRRPASASIRRARSATARARASASRWRRRSSSACSARCAARRTTRSQRGARIAS